MFTIIIYTIVLVGLLIASVSDIKTTEVPDWLNYSLIIIGLGVRLLYSTVTFDWSIMLYGLAGFGIFFAFSCMMFYTGQWGGGDSKLLMGIGALLGFNFTLEAPIFIFLINLFLAGAVYGLVWTLFLAVKHRTKLLKDVKGRLQQEGVKKLRMAVLMLMLAFIILSIFVADPILKTTVLVTALLCVVMFYLWIMIKSVEDTCMLKWVSPRKLTEGDWIAKDVKVKAKYICGPKDLGVEKKQIKKLIKLKVKKVLLKQGIPFVPSFLIGFIVMMFFGAWWVF